MSKAYLLPVLAVVMLGCSGDDESGSAVAEVPGFCSEWAIRACNDDVVGRCSAADGEACRASQAAFCESIVPVGKYSSGQAKGCLDAVERAYEDAQLDGEELALVRELGAPCDLILSGDSGPGQACSADSDCNREADLSCVIRRGEAEGTCQVAEEVGGGEECSADNAVCADGFYCDGSNCLAERREGSDCSPTQPCALEFNCERPDGTAPGPDDTDATCVARLSTGGDCEKSTDCVSGICAVGATGAGVCANAVILAPTEPICDDLR